MPTRRVPIPGRAVQILCVHDPSGYYAGRALSTLGFQETLEAGYLPPGSIWMRDDRFYRVLGNERAWPDGILARQRVVAISPVRAKREAGPRGNAWVRAYIERRRRWL